MGLVDPLTAGLAYSRHCLVSGWALMLIMFAAGIDLQNGLTGTKPDWIE